MSLDFSEEQAPIEYPALMLKLCHDHGGGCNRTFAKSSLAHPSNAARTQLPRHTVD